MLSKGQLFVGTHKRWNNSECEDQRNFHKRSSASIQYSKAVLISALDIRLRALISEGQIQGLGEVFRACSQGRPVLTVELLFEGVRNLHSQICEKKQMTCVFQFKLFIEIAFSLKAVKNKKG